jgi:hypothetical protein
MTIARTPKVALCAALLTLAACTPAQAGEDPHAVFGMVKVTPPTARHGEEVDLRVHACRSPKGAVAKSEAFDHPVRLKPAADGGLFGEARVAFSIHPGSYRISVDCDGRTHVAKGRITVIAGKKHHHHQPHHPTHRQPHHPTAPVRAGGGGTAADSAGVPGHLALGLGGATAIGLVGAALLRRRAVSAPARHGNDG